MNSLDVYKFINSQAIRTHCRKIEHKFSSVEAAYLIWASESHTIEDKHNAFHMLIEEFPDMEIDKRPWTPHIKSLHSFLKQFIQIENKYISMFYKDEPDCVYSYEIWYPCDEDYCCDSRLFTEFQVCYGEIQKDVHEFIEEYKDKNYDISSVHIKVKKQWLNLAWFESAKEITLLIDHGNNPTYIYDCRTIISDDDSEILDAFRGMWPEIPTPFKTGDILTYKNKHNRDCEPFVLDKILYWENAVPEKTLKFLRSRGDESDLMADIYGIADDDTLYRDHGPSYLDMEYYEKELEGFERILAVISGFLKNEYNVAVLIEAYEYMKNEKKRKISYDYLSAYKNPYLIAAGFKEKR